MTESENAPPTALQHRYSAELAKVELQRIKDDIEIARTIVFEDRDAQPYRDALTDALNAVSRAALAAEARAQQAEEFATAKAAGSQ